MRQLHCQQVPYISCSSGLLEESLSTAHIHTHLDTLSSEVLVCILRDVPVEGAEDVVLRLNQLDVDVVLNKLEADISKKV